MRISACKSIEPLSTTIVRKSLYDEIENSICKTRKANLGMYKRIRNHTRRQQKGPQNLEELRNCLEGSTQSALYLLNYLCQNQVKNIFLQTGFHFHIQNNVSTLLGE